MSTIDERVLEALESVRQDTKAKENGVSENEVLVIAYERTVLNTAIGLDDAEMYGTLRGMLLRQMKE